MMGGQVSLNPEEQKARLRSTAIDRELRLSAKKLENTFKILVLGADMSGKSTLIKQMRIIHGDGYSVEELKYFKTTIHSNLLFVMKSIVRAMDKLKIPLSDSSNEVYASAILEADNPLDPGTFIPPHIKESIKAIMHDKGFQESFHRAYEYELSDYGYYFIQEIERVLGSNYIPNEQDVLHSFVRTTGIIETGFEVGGFTYRIFDVGGVRSERRKWLSCFDNTKAVLFVASLDGYDMTLFEDGTTNRLGEALNLFGAICNNAFFKKTILILILNKMDLFKEKIMRSVRHLRLFFPEYIGPDHDTEIAAKFILEQFQVQNTNKNKTIYHHFITATDTNNVQVVLKAVFDSIIRDNLPAILL